MKKKLFVLLLAVVCICMLTGCFCQHEWLEATCVAPSTCAKCEKTTGEALGHSWLAATCETPKTCEVCGATEGEANGHSWADATCEAPKTCTACSTAEGEPLGHQWQDATTELPKTCSVCAATEGERIITDPRFTTAETAAIQGTWGCDLTFTGQDMSIPEFKGEMLCRLLVNFSNDGHLTMGMEILNMEEFTDFMVEYTMESTYAQLAAQGMSKGQADAFVRAEYDMTMEEYIRSALSSFDYNSIFEGIFSSISCVYYMEDGMLYTGMSWDLMEEDPCTLEGDTLVIHSLSEELNVEGIMTRITE